MDNIRKDCFYITADIVVFTIKNNELNVLLIKRKNQPFKGMFALPGGFVELKENLRDAALRELKEETGVENAYLRKLHPIGHVNRDPRARIITIPWMALVDETKVNVKASTDAEIAQWFSINDLPKLGFDHEIILNDALKELRFEIQTTNIAYHIMRDKFTLTELQNAYETILGKTLDKRNFRKKIKFLDILKKLTESKLDGAHRPAQLYSFRSKKYQPLNEKMQVFL
jgi:8-oxo-dGTP diphosphatase